MSTDNPTVYETLRDTWRTHDDRYSAVDFATVACAALGLDPEMPLKELVRKNPCSCPIMTTAVYRDCLDWDNETLDGDVPPSVHSTP